MCVCVSGVGKRGTVMCKMRPEGKLTVNQVKSMEKNRGKEMPGRGNSMFRKKERKKGK